MEVLSIRITDHSSGVDQTIEIISPATVRAAVASAVRSPTQRFVDNGDGTVTDTTTGLMWSKEDIGDRQSWEPADKACRALTLAGFSDWRLPTRAELLTLVDDTRHEPVIDVSAFPACKSSWYWTGTLTAWDPSCAWFVYFSGGSTSYYRRGSGAFVRAVRSAHGAAGECRPDALLGMLGARKSVARDAERRTGARLPVPDHRMADGGGGAMTPATFAAESIRGARNVWVLARGKRKDLAWQTFLLCVDAFNIVADIQLEQALSQGRLGKR